MSDSVVRRASRMSAAILMSRVLGLVREQVFAYLFGASHAMDAFNVAFRIPNLLRDLFAEGAMSAALVPVFTRTRMEDGAARAWQVAGRVFRALFLIASGIAVFGILFSQQLVEFYAGAFAAVPGKIELTTRLTQILFPFFPAVALAAAFMGVLNASGVFFLPAFASALFNLSSIVTGVVFAWLAPRYGMEPIYGMALGVVIGGAVQAGCQIPALFKNGYRYPAAAEKVGPAWNADPRLRAMLWAVVPGTVGLAATQVNILVNTVLATGEGGGAVSWLNYAFRLMQFPIGLFGVAMGAAALPRFSELWVQKDLPAVDDALSRNLRVVFAINLPAAAGLIALAHPIVRLLFEHGRFSSQDTAQTALALQMYSIGLASYSAVKVLVPACYALGSTRIAVESSLLSVALTVSLNLLLVQRLGFWALALGTAVAAVFNQAYLMFRLRQLLRGHGGYWHLAPVIRGVFAYGLAAAALGFAVFGLEYGVTSVGVGGTTKLGQLAWVCGEITLGIAFYVLVCWVGGLSEGRMVVLGILRRVKKRLARTRN